MTAPSRSILLVEDDENARYFIGRFFTGHGFRVAEAGGMTAALEAFRQGRPDVVVLDQGLPDGSGLQVLQALREMDSTVPIIIVTGQGTIDLAVRAIKEGAEQFLTKPVELPALLVVVQRALENQSNRRARLAGRTQSARLHVDPFVGDDPAIKRLAEQARRVAGSSSPVLIQGETGCGKGVLARWIHLNGPRRDESLVDLNCAGLSRELLESELFGHEKGAFTGAVASKPGLLEVAHRGSLFLDELAEMDGGLQAKLLKVLEEQRFRRIGEVRDRQVDFRLVAATHRDLKRMVKDGQFRADLFYRINAVPLWVPPLRDRGSDIVLLARLILDKVAAEVGRPGVRLAAEAEPALLSYSWPGNLRELRNVLERAVLLGDGPTVRAADLADLAPEAPQAPLDADLSLRAAERRHVLRVLQAQEGNVVRAAAALGLSRSALYKKLRAHSLPTAKEMA